MHIWTYVYAYAHAYRLAKSKNQMPMHVCLTSVQFSTVSSRTPEVPTLSTHPFQATDTDCITFTKTTTTPLDKILHILFSCFKILDAKKPLVDS